MYDEPEKMKTWNNYGSGNKYDKFPKKQKYVEKKPEYGNRKYNSRNDREYKVEDLYFVQGATEEMMRGLLRR